MSLVPNRAIEGAAGNQGYNIQRSLRFRSNASAYLSRTGVASPTNNKIFTYSGWVKRGALGGGGQLLSAGGSVSDQLFFQTTTDVLKVYMGADVLVTSQVFRDPSAWYHIVLAVDTTQSTASNRVLLYVNGTQVTAFSSTSYPSQNYVPKFNASSAAATIARYQDSAAEYFDGYLTEVNFIDGQALTPSSFGETDTETGVWKPKKYSGTYGTNGFYLPFSDNTSATTLAYDKSGNGNNWTPNNISTTAGSTYDSMMDVPTLTNATAANYCVWNAADPSLMSSGSRTISNGNLTVSDASTSYGLAARGTIWQSSGKWYWEVNCTSIGSTAGNIGFCDANKNGVFYQSSGQRNPTAENTGTTSYGSSYTTGDVIGIALNLDANEVTFYKNNVSQGAVSFSTGLYTPAAGDGANGSTYVWDLNCGQRPFSYTPPTGFNALNTFNLPDPTIKKGSDYFNAVVYAGNSPSSQTISVGFQPDFVWQKSRSQTYSHTLYDAVRGATKRLASNETAAESTVSNGLTAFTSSGFTVGADGELNDPTGTHVAWNWKESATAGFDIVTYTGTGVARTVSHSLGVAPAMQIVKCRDAAYSWIVWHKAFGAAGNTDYMFLEGTGGKGSAGSYDFWNGTVPSSTVVNIGTQVSVNENAKTYVAYLFAEIAGFSKFGSYTGNGSTDGTFVYCGFRPKYVMVKASSNTSEWCIYDSSRDAYNVMGQTLYADASSAESSIPPRIDFLSNGFKLRSASEPNWSGYTVIYAAFAENPFKYANAR